MKKTRRRFRGFRRSRRSSSTGTVATRARAELPGNDSLRALLQVLRRDRVVRSLAIPVHRHDPPTLAVVQQLNAVDPARERLRVLGGTLRVVRAERVSHVAERVRLSADLALEEPVALEVRA